MKDDFGYFGSGLEGYVHYNEAFKRNFDSASIPPSIAEDDAANKVEEDDTEIDDDTEIYLEDGDM